MGTLRTEAQRAASQRNSGRSTGPRTPEGRIRSSLNRTTHGLNAVRLLLPTEDVEEYRHHLAEWVQSLGPCTAGEHQIVQLVADLAWRLRRLQRIEERRALAILDELVEDTPESKNRTLVLDLVVGLDAVAQTVSTTVLPVPSTAARHFVLGVSGVMDLLQVVRGVLSIDLWPEAAVRAFLKAGEELAREAETREAVSEGFVALAVAASTLADAMRALIPALNEAVTEARTAISTNTLLADDEDRRFERHRRILEASMSRQLDLLAKVRAVAVPAAGSGSFEQAPPVQLRVVSR